MQHYEGLESDKHIAKTYVSEYWNTTLVVLDYIEM